MLGLSGVVFVVVQLNTYSDQIDLDRFNATSWFFITMLAILYGTANALLVRAWWHLLDHFGIKVKSRWATKTFGMAQLAKYVPGNIFHLAGRQALGMADGLPGLALAKSVMWELGLFACAGAFFGGVAATLIWAELSWPILLSAFLAISLGSIAALRRFWSPAIGTAFACQIFFLTISSAVFVGTLAISAPLSVTFSAYVTICAAYIIAWLAGLVTPGAPAGVGVRELILLFLLKGMVNESDLLLAVVLGRFVTVLGDFLFFVYAYFSPKASVSA